MTRPAGQPSIAETFAGYARSRRKQRAWAADNAGNGEIRRELAAALLGAAAGPLMRGGEALDVGCGSGWWLRELAEAGARPERLHGVELLPTRASAAQRTVPGARVIDRDARDLPYASDRFGLVTLIVLLSSLPDAQSRHVALAEAYRVLSPGGVLAVWDLRWPSPNPRVRRIRGGEVPGIVRMGDVLEGRSITLFPPLARRLGRAAPQLYAPLSRVPLLRSHRLVIVRKASPAYSPTSPLDS